MLTAHAALPLFSEGQLPLLPLLRQGMQSPQLLSFEMSLHAIPHGGNGHLCIWSLLWQSYGEHLCAHSCPVCTACLFTLFFSQSILFLSREFCSFRISLRILIRCLYCACIWFSVFSCIPLIIFFFRVSLFCFVLFLCYPFYSEVWLTLLVYSELRVRRATWFFPRLLGGFSLHWMCMSVSLLFS